MPNGRRDEPSLSREIWGARVKGTSLWSGLRGGVKGAGWGATGGAMVGGIGGAVAGAGVGAGIGVAIGTVAAATQRLVRTMERLEQISRRLIENYKEFNPVIARLRHQWVLLDRRLNRAWADTIAPTLKKLTDVGTEFKERWTKMKIEFFQAIEPHLVKLVDVFQKVGRVTFWITSKLLKVVTGLLDGLTKLLKLLGWLPEESTRGLTQTIKPFAMEWPTVEGPLTGAMERAGLAGPPFTGEEPRRPPTRGAEAEGEAEAKKVPFPFVYTPKEMRELYGFPEKEEEKKGKPEVNVNVNVSDSKELSAVFERVWHDAT